MLTFAVNARVLQQAAAEQEEDYISNKLLRRIDEVKAEKARLLQQLERDEQYMADTLQKQLKQVRRPPAFAWR